MQYHGVQVAIQANSHASIQVRLRMSTEGGRTAGCNTDGISWPCLDLEGQLQLETSWWDTRKWKLPPADVSS